MGIGRYRSIRLCAFAGNNLDIGIRFQSFLNLTGFSGIEEINNSMAFQVNHHCSVRDILTESKVIHTNLCDAGLIHRSRHFF